MEINKSITIAKEIMNKHGLLNWTLRLGTAKRQNGSCFTHKKRITLSKNYISLNTEELVIDTILHEIAHALVGSNHGHDNVWKQKCIEIGARPVRTKDNIVSVVGKYDYKCKKCEIIVHAHRQKRREIACADCCNKYNNGRFTKEYLFERVENGRSN